jgi:hypothetical protein
MRHSAPKPLKIYKVWFGVSAFYRCLGIIRDEEFKIWNLKGSNEIQVVGDIELPGVVPWGNYLTR